MDQGKSTLLSVGGVLIVAAVALPAILFAGEGFDAILGGLAVLFIVSPILFIVGIALLIAGASRGGQQQQQQVVVVSESQAAAQGLTRHCTQCGSAVPAGHRFCNGCGTGVAHG